MKTNHKISLVTSILGLVFMATPATSSAATVPDGGECLVCHQNLLSESMGNMSVHEPFASGQCATCHLDDNDAAIQDPNTETTQNSGPSAKINWLDKSLTPAENQWFVVPASRLHSSIYVETRDYGTEKSMIMVDLPSVNNARKIINDHTPPVINNVAALDIEKGIYISATITWTTDKISDSTVTFDSGSSKTSSYNAGLTENHRITIIGLKPEQEYKFSVSSKDFFGNHAESADLTFNTASAKIADNIYQTPNDSGMAQLESEIYAANDSYLIKISASRPALLAIGTNQEVTGPTSNIYGQMNDAGAAKHGTMKIKIDRTVSLCLKCHNNYQGMGSHPVNISATRGMVIPADYPTSPDGKITCLTCHKAHASGIKYMLRKSRDRELCVGCHQDKDNGSPRRQLMANLME